MALQTVTAKTILKEGERKGEEVSGSIEYDFGDNLADASSKFGDDVVFSLFEQQARIQCQARMRAELLAPTGSVTRVAEQWKPGVQMRASVDPIAAAKNAVAGMDPEAKKAFMKKMQAELANM
jgi:hypothetical protein